MKDWNGVPHPDWCDMDRCVVIIDEAGRHAAVEHLSRPILCDRTGHEQVSVSAYLWQPAGRSGLPVVKVEIVDDHCGVSYPLLTQQAVALGRALVALSEAVDREPNPVPVRS